MIILITGASHTGKTLLAQKMLERFSFPYLSIDHLKMGLIRSGNTALTPEDDDELTGYLWPVVREMIKTAIENDQNLIVEGCYVPFDWRADFDEDYLSAIRFVCLAFTDEYIDAHFDEIRQHASDIESRIDDSCCSSEKLKAENRKYIEGFSAPGEEIVLINSEYEKTKNEAKTIWGDTAAYKQYEEKAKSYSAQDQNDLAAGMDQIMSAFAACKKSGETAASAGAQALVGRLQNYITAHCYTCTDQILAGLGQMYVADERFRQNIDKHGMGTAAFIRDAIEAYCK